MSSSPAYGKMNKKIVFTENDGQHAKLIVRLKYDNLRQSEFFRACIRGYLEQDERIVSFIDDLKKQSATKKKKSKKLRLQGKELLNDVGFSDTQIEDLFDLIAEEHPDL